MQREFSVLGLTIEKIAISAGLFLVVWASVASILGESRSITSWIPAFLGGPILIVGCLALLLPGRRKLLMHLVAAIALLTLLGGLDFFRPVLTGQNPLSNPVAGFSKLMLFCVGGLLLFSCIRSFVWARKNKARGDS